MSAGRYYPVGPGSGGASKSGRTILTADMNYYVSTLGSDSNPGTLAAPWATTQHAMNVLGEKIDSSGFNQTVNIGAGSFAGFGIKSCVGGGNILFKGAGSGSTTITNGPNDGVFNFGECVALNVISDTPLGVNGVTFAPTGTKCVGIYQPGFFFYLAEPFGPNTPDIRIDCTGVPDRLIDIESYSDVQDFGPSGGGTITVIGANKTINFGIFCLFGGAYFQGSNWVFSGNLTINNGTVNVGDAGSFSTFGGSMTGAGVTATRFFIGTNGFMDLADSAGTFIPGNSPGVITSGGQYSGITDYNGNVGGLPAAIKGAKAFVTDSLNPVFASIAAGGGAVYTPVYADGTNWRWG